MKLPKSLSSCLCFLLEETSKKATLYLYLFILSTLCVAQANKYNKTAVILQMHKNGDFSWNIPSFLNWII